MSSLAKVRMGSKNFHHTIQPLWKIARILGLFPFSSETIKTRKRDVAWTVTVIIILIITAILNFSPELFALECNDFFGCTIWLIIIIIRIMMILVQLFTQLCHLSTIKELCELIVKCDRKMEKLDLKVNHEMHRKIISIVLNIFILIPIFYFVSFMFVQNFVFDFYDHILLIMEFSFSLDMIYSCFFCLQFSIFSLSIKERFKILKRFIGTMTHHQKNEELKLFANIFHDLCDSIDLINSCITYHLVPTILTMVILDIFSCFIIIIHTYTIDDDYTYIISNSYYFFMNFIIISLTSFAGSSTTEKARKIIGFFGKSINNLTADYEISRPASNLILIQFQSRNIKLKNKFFEVNWNVLITVSSFKATLRNKIV